MSQTAQLLFVCLVLLLCIFVVVINIAIELTGLRTALERGFGVESQKPQRNADATPDETGSKSKQ